MVAIPRGPGRRKLLLALNSVLVLANLVALNVLARPLGARLDLTEERLYTLSDVTRKTFAELPDKVELHGYFSQETHPKLAPLVPKIADLVEELRQLSKGKLEVTFTDPRGDEEAEKEAFQRFNVRATPFRLQSKYESGVKSAYFDLVLAFGDRSEHLRFDDIVEVEAKAGDVEVRLRNLEYQLVGAIRKLVREFGSLESRLLDRKEPVRLTVFLTAPEKVPEQAKAVREFLEKKKAVVTGALEDLAKRLKGGLATEIIDADPAQDDPGARPLVERYGVRPVRLGLQSAQAFFLDAVLQASGRAERIDLRDHPDQELTRYGLAQEIEAAIRRLLPGALRRVGFATPRRDFPPEIEAEYRRRGAIPPRDEFQRLREVLSQNFEVVDVDLGSGRPPLEVDLLCVLRPTDFTDKHCFALDQYLMFGGKAIVCVDRTEIDLEGSRFGRIRLKEVRTGLDDVLARYGVSVRRELLLDDRNVAYPLPVVRDLGGIRIESIEHVPYPWFVHAKGDSIDRQNPVTGRVAELALLWPSPIAIDPEKTKGLATSVLVRSSDRAWTTADLRSADPKLGTRGAKGYLVPEKTARETLAVSVEGSLASAFRDRAVPTGTALPEGGLEPLLESPPSTRLVVIGNAQFASDLAANILGGMFAKGAQFFANLCDWALVEEDLIRIRGRGTADRSLRTLEREEKARLEALNYAAPAAIVLLVGLGRALLRRQAKKRARAGNP